MKDTIILNFEDDGIFKKSKLTRFFFVLRQMCSTQVDVMEEGFSHHRPLIVTALFR